MHENALKQRLEAGGKANPFWICGPCVIESRELVARVAEELKRISERHQIPVVFKASFDKANRTSHKTYRGVGLEEGLKTLAWVKQHFALPILTDIHETSHAGVVSEVADIIQIPAFLCRQTDLIEAACRTGRLVNIKKGQFLSPSMVEALVQKLAHFKNQGFWITERGVCFGYGRLIVDFASFPEMEAAEAPLVLDITHAVQLPGGQKNSSGGIREAIPYLARAGAAVGVTGFFAESHPNPDRALSDGPNAWPLSDLEGLMLKTKQIAEISHRA